MADGPEMMPGYVFQTVRRTVPRDIPRLGFWTKMETELLARCTECNRIRTTSETNAVFILKKREPFPVLTRDMIVVQLEK